MKGSRSIPPDQIEVTTLGGGCFWCLEATLKEIRGVEQVQSGYSGGSLVHPTYEQVSTGTTGYVEVVQVRYNPIIISFKELLEIFFTIHDPTTMNRQGPDVGPQYRSIIFYHNSEQKTIAEKVIQDLNSQNIWKTPIVTQIEPFTGFHEAEDYHQDFYERNPKQPYCQLIIEPKLLKLREQHREKLKKP